MMIALLPSTIVSAWESSSIRRKVAVELSLLMLAAQFIDEVRRLEVLFAATTVCIISLKVTFVDCFVTFNTIVVALTAENDGDRHSFFCYFF